MTRDEAITVARDFLLKNGRGFHLDPLEVRPMQAARFNSLFGQEKYPCDFWVIEFLKILPAGIAFESPGSWLVEVIPASGEVREVHPGM